LPFIASAVMTLSPEHPLRQILEPQGIKSLVTIPVCTGGECVGFIGFDSVRTTHHYTDVEVSLLSLLAELVANAQTKRDREQKLLDTLLSLEESRNSALTMAAIASSANEAKSRFVATMSHEIRTPLHVILGTTELLRSSGLREDQIEHLEALEASGHNLLELIGDVLEVSRIESGNLVLNPVEFSLQAFVQGLQKVLQPLASRKGLSLVFNIAPGFPDLLSHDAIRLRQIVQNVAGNAIKFTEHGKVTVDIGLQRQASPSRQGDWSLAVIITDTGIGMSPEEVTHLYEPFYQAAESRKSVIAGTGLGLAITHNLVELMSGSIVVNSAPGRGTTFTIRIPIQIAYGSDCATDNLADHEPIAPGPGGDLKAVLDGTRILIAEDNEISQRLIKAHLSDFNCKLTFAGNGEQAVSAVADCDFDIILMDCQMPVLDGFGATESICAMLRRQSRPRPPIIAATANSVHGDRERCLAAGMDSMLSKPFSKSDLLSTLSSWLTSAAH
jgi:signal transduction histidine kinase